uniref:Uncharacterized protein n=1 Tax=Arundo donax TaxID=35708 RepID=A0A0A9A5Z4_ARUDO
MQSSSYLNCFCTETKHHYRKMTKWAK